MKNLLADLTTVLSIFSGITESVLGKALKVSADIRNKYKSGGYVAGKDIKPSQATKQVAHALDYKADKNKYGTGDISSGKWAHMKGRAETLHKIANIRASREAAGDPKDLSKLPSGVVKAHIRRGKQLSDDARSGKGSHEAAANHWTRVGNILGAWHTAKKDDRFKTFADKAHARAKDHSKTAEHEKMMADAESDGASDTPEVKITKPDTETPGFKQQDSKSGKKDEIEKFNKKSDKARAKAEKEEKSAARAGSNLGGRGAKKNKKKMRDFMKGNY